MTYLTSVSIRDAIRIYGIPSRQETGAHRHKMVMSLFGQNLGDSPRSRLNILYRLEQTSRGASFIIRSDVPPAAIPGVRTMEEQVSYPEGSLLSFRTTLNPIKRLVSKEYPIIDEDEQVEWILKKLAPALTNVNLVNIESEILKRKEETRDVIQLTKFDGVATVGDSEALTRLLVEGVGRSKNYGAGLLTVKRLS